MMMSLLRKGITHWFILLYFGPRVGAFPTVFYGIACSLFIGTEAVFAQAARTLESYKLNSMFSVANEELQFQNTTNLPPPDSMALGESTMFFIIGCLVGSFLFAFMLQCFVREYINRRRERREEDVNELGITNVSDLQIPEITSIPPSYDDIHLFRQLDLSKCTPIYYTVPGSKNYYGILIRDEESEIDLEEPPKYYEQTDNDDNDDDEDEDDDGGPGENEDGNHPESAEEEDG